MRKTSEVEIKVFKCLGEISMDREIVMLHLHLHPSLPNLYFYHLHLSPHLISIYRDLNTTIY